MRLEAYYTTYNTYIGIQFFVADITEPSILELNVLQKYDFTLKLEKDECHALEQKRLYLDWNQESDIRIKSWL